MGLVHGLAAPGGRVCGLSTRPPQTFFEIEGLRCPDESV